ncbi:MAG TPA: alpha-galactosidase, partial [Mucilaginibacter sp.]
MQISLRKPFYIALFLFSLQANKASAQNPSLKILSSCKATLANDVLTLENDQLSRSYKWNNGDLISTRLTDKKNKYTWLLNGNTPDCILPGSGKAENGTLDVKEVPATTIAPAYLRAQVDVKLGVLFVRRVFRIYPGCPAIACDFYLKGSVEGNWATANINAGDLHNIEKLSAINDGKANAPVIENLALPGKHWRLQSVEFFDVTDRRNNLVQEYKQLLYSGESQLKGNLLFADDALNDHGIFILKEAPTSDAQLAYPGFDFKAHWGSLQAVGIGVLPHDLHKDQWIRCYSFVTGVTANGVMGRLKALRTYQQNMRTHLPGRDDMVLLNTWGDRSKDKKIGEDFSLKELIAAQKLGVTHFQIDDGWQTGRSANSAFSGGSFNKIWSNPDYWTPDIKKFPNGLTPIVALGKKLGIEVCVWFNPSQDSSYRHWQDDAGALISLYKKYGIHTFKIDGVQVVDKQGEINLRKMLDTVVSVTHNQAVFNLDVTAGKRYGYYYFNEYGNIFLENRYTDFGNYYPSWTLRNLWMLSRYVPPQNLQIEFLNNFRNADKYAKDDLLAPSTVSFDYGFALTMMAQPLAWMEATGLPEKAFNAAPIIKKYVKLQSKLHSGQIFPIGDEPTGTSWTGFQSVMDG